MVILEVGNKWDRGTKEVSYGEGTTCLCGKWWWVCLILAGGGAALVLEAVEAVLVCMDICAAAGLVIGSRVGLGGAVHKKRESVGLRRALREAFVAEAKGPEVAAGDRRMKLAERKVELGGIGNRCRRRVPRFCIPSRPTLGTYSTRMRAQMHQAWKTRMCRITFRSQPGVGQ
jgi:hypothetical protein